jgi:hypothetical protein
MSEDSSTFVRLGEDLITASPVAPVLRTILLSMLCTSKGSIVSMTTVVADRLLLQAGDLRRRVKDTAAILSVDCGRPEPATHCDGSSTSVSGTRCNVRMLCAEHRDVRLGAGYVANGSFFEVAAF